MKISEKTVVIILFISLINLLYPTPISSIEDTEINEISLGYGYGFCEENKTDPVYTLPETKNKEPKKSFWLTMTAYSSTPDQTSGDPFITASGDRVKDGIIAYNYLPFGTYVKFPEVFGNKIFVVKDRLPQGASVYLADMWVHTRKEAKTWGAKVVKVEVL